MPLISKYNTRHVYRTLYAGTGALERVTLLKRDDDQRQGTIRAVELYNCRRGKILKTGEAIQGDMSSDHATVWHVPRSELDRAGVTHLNAIDVIVDGRGRHWQPEATTNIEVKLFENEIDLECLRIDPPAPAAA